ncbi:MAG TPA: hypothetical protein PKA27_09380 [Fimbriimonadaceae bacterium]|nr:hypothetical protein [Fimbriimonadaceae bacterium]
MKAERDSNKTIRVLWSVNFWLTLVVCVFGIFSGAVIINGALWGPVIALGLTLVLLALYLSGLLLSVIGIRAVPWWQIGLQLILPPLCWFGTLKAVDIVPRMRAKAAFESKRDLYERAAQWVIANPPSEKLMPSPDSEVSVQVEMPKEFEQLGSVRLTEYERLRCIEFQGPALPGDPSAWYTYCRILSIPDSKRDSVDMMGPNWFLNTDSS